MQNVSSIEPKKSIPRHVFITILLFATLAHITADMYVPSMPAITRTFASPPAAVQLTLFTFMLGYSLAHLFYGPLSDRIGRRQPILTGIAISMIGTACCMLSSSIGMLMVGRCLQGLGVAVCNSVGRSLTRDLLSGSHLARISSHLGMIMVFVTATAPTLGGYIQHYFDWRAVFGFLFVYTTFIWLFTWKVLPETNIHLNPEATKIKTVLRNYFILLTNKTFLGYTLCVSAAYAGIIAYVTEAPFLLQTIVGLTPVQFGWLAFVIGGAIFISFFINSRFVLEVGIEKMLFTGICLMLTAGVLMLLLGLFGFINVFVIMLPVAIFCMGVGLTFSNASAGAFHPFPKMAGSVGALFGCIQILGGACASMFMAAFTSKNQLSLAVVFILLGLLSLFSWKYLATKEKYQI